MKTILTLGYQGTTFSKFLRVLQEAKVTHLVDIRRHNIYYKSPFNKYRLETGLLQVGIAYRSEYTLAPSAKLLQKLNLETENALSKLKAEFKQSQKGRKEWNNQKRLLQQKLFETMFKDHYIEELLLQNWMNTVEKIIQETEQPCFLCCEQYEEIDICHRKLLTNLIAEKFSNHASITHLRENFCKQGEVYNLEERFALLNRRYFSNNFSLDEFDLTWWKIRPAWGRSGLGMFHYYFDDYPPTIQIHERLDSIDIPITFVDAVLYHELLHYKRFADGLPCGHTLDFYLEEQQFDQYAEAFQYENRDIFIRLLSLVQGDEEL